MALPLSWKPEAQAKATRCCFFACASGLHRTLRLRFRLASYSSLALQACIVLFACASGLHRALRLRFRLASHPSLALQAWVAPRDNPGKCATSSRRLCLGTSVAHWRPHCPKAIVAEAGQAAGCPLRDGEDQPGDHASLGRACARAPAGEMDLVGYRAAGPVMAQRVDALARRLGHQFVR